MKAICQNKNIDMVVLFIPTKVSVFSELIEHNPKIPNSETIDKLIDSERKIKKIIINNLQKKKIDYLDVLIPLQKALVKERIYPQHHDGHPNQNGYRVIAEEVSKYCGKYFAKID